MAQIVGWKHGNVKNGLLAVTRDCFWLKFFSLAGKRWHCKCRIPWMYILLAHIYHFSSSELNIMLLGRPTSAWCWCLILLDTFGGWWQKPTSKYLRNPMELLGSWTLKETRNGLERDMGLYLGAWGTWSLSWRAAWTPAIICSFCILFLYVGSHGCLQYLSFLSLFQTGTDPIFLVPRLETHWLSQGWVHCWTPFRHSCRGYETACSHCRTGSETPGRRASACQSLWQQNLASSVH